MKAKQGFTLIETLIALAVIGAISAVTITAMTSSLRQNSTNRAKVQAVAAAEAWLDRFRSKSLDYTLFTTAKTYAYGYDYSADSTFVAAADTNAAALNSEWKPFSFIVQATAYTTNPVVALWQIKVTTTYRAAGGESNFVVNTLVKQ
jgi:prepilin-type N-terminal cleavage/methylation domain-containing protein